MIHNWIVFFYFLNIHHFYKLELKKKKKINLSVTNNFSNKSN